MYGQKDGRAKTRRLRPDNSGVVAYYVQLIWLITQQDLYFQLKAKAPDGP